jgi:hypothetical protein
MPPMAARDTYVILPLKLVYRPLSCFDAGKVSINGRQQFDGRSVLVLKCGDEIVWVDPARDYLPVRYYEMRGQAVLRFIEIEYLFDKGNGWVPKSWKDNSSSIDNYASTITVDRYKINTPIPASAFELTPVAGAVVSDYSTNQFYVNREDDKRTIAPGEWKGGQTYQQILNSDARTGNGRLLMSLALVIVGIASFMVWRKYQIRMKARS